MAELGRQGLEVFLDRPGPQGPQGPLVLWDPTVIKGIRDREDSRGLPEALGSKGLRVLQGPPGLLAPWGL